MIRVFFVDSVSSMASGPCKHAEEQAGVLGEEVAAK